MRKITSMLIGQQKIMYMPLTVVGNPTIINGVVSEFTTSKYLALQNQFTLNPTTKADFVFKINISSFGSSDQAVFSTLTNYGFQITIFPNGKIYLRIGNYNSWIINKTSSISLTSNTDYWIKLAIDNNVITLYYSTDGKTYNIAISSTNMNLEEENKYDIVIGRGTISLSFKGSIDLNNSYPILNGTKYKYTLP